MLVCIAVFRTPVSLLGGVGSAVAILGSYVYAMTKTQEKIEADKAAAEVVDAIHSYGGLVFHDVTNLRHARKAAEAEHDR